MWFVWLSLGLFIGANVGLFAFALCRTAARGDEQPPRHGDDQAGIIPHQSAFQKRGDHAPGLVVE